MANLVQLKMLEDLNGFLLIDKPAGIAFASVVKAVKRKFNLVKVGHGGSLEAQASGLFLILLGDANKFVDRVMGADREYELSVDFSLRTNTGDVQGVEGARSAEFPPADLSGRLANCRGDVFQVEPRFAAIRKEGTADYEVVDTGEHKPFLGHIYRLEIAEGDEGKNPMRFSLLATKQILPRVVADDLGGALSSCRRLKQGKFNVADAVAFDKLLAAEMKDFATFVTPLKEALA